MTYAITGASGQLGRLTADRLLEQIDPAELVLLTRDPAKLADYSERGVTVRAADFTDPASLTAALAGVDRLLLISTDNIGDERVAGHVAAIDAAKAAGVDRVAYTSLPRPDEDNPATVAADHRRTEEHLRASGLHWTALRNNLYGDLSVDAVRHAADTGQWITNNPDGRIAFVTRADCADAAAGALLSDEAADRSYDITGPEGLAAADLAELASKLGGRPVEVVAVDDDAFTAGLVGAGLPPFLAGVLTAFGAAGRDGWLAGVSDSVHTLTGHAPAPFADLLG
jgi:NAD(P)H dehydrogenase (quinone)